MTNKVIPNEETALGRLAKDPYFNTPFFGLEVKAAFNIAERFWSRKSESEKAHITTLTNLAFMVWKHKRGEAYLAESSFFDSVKKLEGHEREQAIANLEAWECLPYWEDKKTPISLLFYLFAREPELFPTSAFTDALAWLIIFSFGKQRKDWFPSILTGGMILAQAEMEALDRALRITFPLATAKQKQHKAMEHYNTTAHLEREIRKQDIHKQASSYLANGKGHRGIVSLIHKSMPRIADRTIRRYLEDHPSGHWGAKPQKKVTPV